MLAEQNPCDIGSYIAMWNTGAEMQITVEYLQGVNFKQVILTQNISLE